jgi:8-amino-7-oxononanoate synthase
MGLMGGILQAVYTGVCSVLMAPAVFLQRPFTWLETLSRYGAVSSAAPDSAYRSCADLVRSGAIDRAAVRSLDLSAWRIAFNGAEPVRAATIEAFSDAFRQAGFRREAFVSAYGLAEATLFVSGGPTGVPPAVHPVAGRQAVACGQVATATTVCIVDSERRAPCEPGEPGEIWVQGPQVAAGYWNAPDATAATFGARLRSVTGGNEEPTPSADWLRTGDLGILFGDELVVTGRLKELLIVNGRNVLPQDLEAAAEGAHRAVRRDGTVAAQARDGRVVVLAEVDGGQSADAAVATLSAAVSAAIRTACADQVGVHVDVVVCVPRRALPRTSSGKRQRGHAVSLWESGALAVLGGSAVPDAADGVANATGHSMLVWIGDWIAAECGVPRGEVHEARSLADHGLDSLAMVRLQAALEAAFGVVVPATALWQSTSLAALVDAINDSINDSDPVKSGPSLAEEVAAFSARRAALEQEGNPFFLAVTPTEVPTRVWVDGQSLLSFASYDYLGLAADARVREAAAEAARTLGTSASGSRLIGGERAVHGALEAALARTMGTAAALVFTSGHATGVSVIPQLVGPGDVVCCDARLHNCGWLGARYSGAQLHVFPHNDAEALDALLTRVRARGRRALVLIEGLYSTDGDVPDLAAFVAVKQRRDALLMVDDAHGVGVLGATGRGIAEHQGVAPEAVDLWMGTLSKALGSVGGFVAGAHDLIEWLRYTSPGFVFSAGMPPHSAAAALTAVQLLDAEPWRVTALRRNAVQLRDALAHAGVLPARGADTPGDDTPIIPIVTGTGESAVALSHALRARGVLAAPMLPPSVPEGSARVRLFVTAMHTPAELGRVAEVLAEVFAEIPTDRGAPAF